MSDAADKSFAPTPSRIARARREGNVPRAQELSANAAFLAAIAATIAVAPVVVSSARSCIAAAAHRHVELAAYLELMLAAVSVIAAAGAGAVVASLIQSGGIVVVAPVPSFGKLSPVQGIKRMFSRDGATHAARAAAAFVVACTAIVASTHTLANSTAAGEAWSLGALTWQAAVHVALAAAAVGALFSLAEFGAARRSWLSKLKMSLHDLKRESKENDGDPAMRHRRRSLHRNFIRGAIANVKKASFVVVNPTHVAVALKYDPPTVPIPAVLVRATDDMALRVRSVAAEAGVPIVEDAPLARAIFAAADVGDVIAPEHYVAVAEIVAQLVREGALG